VVRIDNDPKCRPDIVADVRHLPLDPDLRPEFVWASPPCTRFSTASSGRGWNPEEGMELVYYTDQVIGELKPKYWAVENVRGSVRYIGSLWGEPILRKHAYYLWGNVPLGILSNSRRMGKGTPIPDKPKRGTRGHPSPYTHHFKPKRTEEMARIPRPLAEAVHRAVCEA